VRKSEAKRVRQVLRAAAVATMPERTPLEAAKKLHRMMAVDTVLRRRGIELFLERRTA